MRVCVRHRWIFSLLMTYLLAGCASYKPNPNLSSFHDRIQTQRQGNIQVTVSVLTRKESREFFGVDLGLKSIQPVWVSIENRDSHPYWMLSSGLDPEYFSPHEVAYSLQRSLQSGFNEDLERYFEKHSFFNPIPANTTHSGFFFVNLDEDEKELDIDLISKNDIKYFDFFFELSGLKTHSLHQIEEQLEKKSVRQLDEAELRKILQELPCCTTSQDGEVLGDPLNLVLIGNSEQLLPPFVRRGWHYAEDSYFGSVWKTINSFLFGKHYRYSPVSNLYFNGRKQDVALQKARGTVHQRNHLRLWLTDHLYNDKEVWVGQISRDIGVRFTWHTPTFTTHKIDPDLDEARTAFIEDMLFSQGLIKIGFVEGVGERTLDTPGYNLTEDEYYSDGLRAVLEFDARPSNIENVRFFEWVFPPKRRIYDQ